MHDIKLIKQFSIQLHNLLFGQVPLLEGRVIITRFRGSSLFAKEQQIVMAVPADDGLIVVGRGTSFDAKLSRARPPVQ